MDKQEFLMQLRKGLSGLPQDDIEERLMFYSEMIDDRTEEGLSEEDAVRAVGNIDGIISQIIAETPLGKLVKEKISTKKRLKVWETVLLILGSPIWLSLMIAAFAVILSFYIVMWAVIVSLWAVFVAFVGSALGSVAICAVAVMQGNNISGVAMLAAGIVCAGLSIFVFFGCKAATKGILILTKKTAVWIKNCFVKKGEA